MSEHFTQKPHVLITDDTNGRVSSKCTGESYSFTITAPQGTDQISFEGEPIFNLPEPPNLGQPISGVPVSETLFQTGATTRDTIESTTSFQFISDTETGLSPLPNSQDLFEDGTAQPTIVIDYFDANSSFTGSDTILVQSEIIEGRVPEPSTWLMALSGLVLLGVPRIRRSCTVSTTGCGRELADLRRSQFDPHRPVAIFWSTGRYTLQAAVYRNRREDQNSVNAAVGGFLRSATIALT